MTLLGVTRAPLPRMILRDPVDRPGVVRCKPPSALDGKQWMIAAVTDAATPLSDDEVALLAGGDPPSRAQWSKGRWAGDAELLAHAHRCP